MKTMEELKIEEKELQKKLGENRIAQKVINWNAFKEKHRVEIGSIIRVKYGNNLVNAKIIEGIFDHNNEVVKLTLILFNADWNLGERKTKLWLSFQTFETV